MSKRTNSQNKLQTYSWEKVFTISLPQGTKPFLEESETLLVIPLSGIPPIEIIAGVFDFSGDDYPSEESLQNEIERFFRDCVKVKTVSIETPTDFDDPNYVALQGVALVEENVWWIARIYAHRKGNEFLLVHAKGNADCIRRSVLQFFVSIVPQLVPDDNERGSG